MLRSPLTAGPSRLRSGVTGFDGEGGSALRAVGVRTTKIRATYSRTTTRTLRPRKRPEPSPRREALVFGATSSTRAIQPGWCSAELGTRPRAREGGKTPAGPPEELISGYARERRAALSFSDRGSIPLTSTPASAGWWTRRNGKPFQPQNGGREIVPRFFFTLGCYRVITRSMSGARVSPVTRYDWRPTGTRPIPSGSRRNPLASS